MGIHPSGGYSHNAGGDLLGVLGEVKGKLRDVVDKLN